MDFDIFGRNVTDKVSNQKTLYSATSNNLCFCTTWQNRKHENCIFTRCISALLEFNQALLYFFNVFDSRIILMRCMTPRILSSMRSVWGFWGHGTLKGSPERCSSLSVELCCTYKAPVCCLLGFLFRKVMLKH